MSQNLIHLMTILLNCSLINFNRKINIQNQLQFSDSKLNFGLKILMTLFNQSELPPS